ncbi:MAG TPA: NUDIX hydrolase [Candidatus Altiarchaeales archaeon]|nr:NUDIX hydrolase [Candidatus Altiarchaeales archaeon]
MERKFPRLTVDAIILRKYSIILIKRKNPPFKGMWALPGGFVEYGETVEEAIIRETKEETGLDVEILNLFNVYSKSDRDPRCHTVSIVFLCRATGGGLNASSDSADVREFKLTELPELAFDHADILKDFLTTMRKHK